MIAILTNNMMTIDADNLNYGDIYNMYVTGNGCGIQVDEGINGEAALMLCKEIASLMYKLNDVLTT